MILRKSGLICCLLILASTSAMANPIVLENQRPGSNRWQLADPAANGEIEGYASLTSVAHGETIRFYVSTADPTYTFEIYRMGWYGGDGGRRVLEPVELPGTVQAKPPVDPDTGLIECRWNESYVLTLPAYASEAARNWVSGVYLVKLTARPSGKQNYIHFVVRDDVRPAHLLFQCSVTTYQAYNNWGGKSLYPSGSQGAPADKISFNRPYSINTGASEFLYQWEYQTLRWLEREGYDVAYCTNVDTHARPPLLLTARAFLSVGHDEYWTWEMRRTVENARDGGLHIAFLSANTAYWQIRLEPASDGTPHRTMVCYKEDALTRDPLLLDGDRTNDHLVTTTFRSAPVNEPEDELIGVMYTYNPVDADMVVENTNHWAFLHTGLRDGDKLPGLVGYEVDRMFGNAPRGTIRLAHSPFRKANGETDYSDMTLYETPRGAIVFATGSMQWAWGLDDFNSRRRGNRVNQAAHQITANVLARMIHGDPRPRRRTAAPTPPR